MSKKLTVVAAMVILVGAMGLKTAVAGSGSGSVVMANGGAPAPPDAMEEWWSACASNTLEERWSTCASDSLEKWRSACASNALEVDGLISDL